MRHRPRWGWAWAPALALLAASSIGFFAVQLRVWSVEAPRIERRLGPVAIEGLPEKVEIRPDSVRVVLGEVRIAGRAPEDTPARVRLVLRAPDIAIAPGTPLAVLGILNPPPAPAMPGAFDNGRALYFERIGAVGFAVGRPTALAAPAGESGLSSLLAAWRHAASARIRETLPGPAGALAAALMTGDRSGLPRDDLAALRDSGLAHILAISGLHFALVAGTLFFVFRALLAAWSTIALRYPIKKWAALAAFLGASGYFLFAVPSVPSARSFLMLGLILVGVLTDRVALTLRPCALAAAAILLLRPESLLGPSFQMSFAAVVALIAAYERLAPGLAGWRRPGGLVRAGLVYLGGVALTSLIASAATAPFGLFHFNRLAVLGLAANLLAVPVLAAWVMPWMILSFIAMPFGLDAPALAAMGQGNALILAVARSIAALESAALAFPAPSVTGLVALTLGGLWLCIWRRPWRHLGWAGIVIGLGSILAHVPPDIVVSGDGKLMAVRGADGSLSLSTGRSRRFDATIWLRRDAQEDPPTLWPRRGESEDGRLRCDDLGCVYRADGHVVALVRDGRALDDDCRVATLVIAVQPVGRACPSAGRVIDRFDLWRDGAHAVTLGPDGARRIESVRARQGERPWTLRPERSPRRDGG